MRPLSLQVTQKKLAGAEQQESHWDEFKRALWVTWPHLLFYAAFVAGTVYFVVRAAMGTFE